MARKYPRSYGKYSRTYEYYNGGREAAMRHIEEAQRLSEELGGTDKDVKNYVFNLPPQQLRAVLDAYGSKFGADKRAYAEATMPAWRSGRRKMSGLVASRLYELLPPLMPMSAKYELVKTLWEQYSPRSHKVLRIGPDASEPAIIAAVRDHIVSTILNYKIPGPLGKRFKWLAMGDVTGQQQLLNHFLDMEKELAVKGAQVQLPVMLKHLRQSGSTIGRLNQSIEIGNHRFDLSFEAKASGVNLEDPRTHRPSSKGGDWSWLWWVAGIALLWLMFFS